MIVVVSNSRAGESTSFGHADKIEWRCYVYAEAVKKTIIVVKHGKFLGI